MDPALSSAQHIAANSADLAHLRQRAEHLYALRDLPLTFPLPGGVMRTYHVALPADPDAPLDQFAVMQHEPSARRDASGFPVASVSGHETASTSANEAGQLAAHEARTAVTAGVHMPYWGLLWPSGVALAEEALMHPDSFKGRRVLELGCGLGVTATAALDAGSSLLAVDCFDEALLFTRYNTLRNTGQIPRTALLDWRTEAGRAACLAAAPFDLLLAADVLYEQENLEPLMALVPDVLAENGVFWLAEPGRRVSRAFVAAACMRGWQDDAHSYGRSWPPDGDTVRVTVHRFTVPHTSTSNISPS